MHGPPEDVRTLPMRRAFVVQLHAEADVAHGRLSGRVEHVLSGQAARFQNLDELLAFLSRMLQTASQGEDGTG